MRLWKKLDEVTVTKLLRLTKNAVAKVVNTDGTESSLNVKRLVLAPVTETGTTIAVTQAEHEGRVIVMSETGGDAAATYTLPAATGTGGRYTFVVGVVNTSNYVIQVADATDTMDGSIISMNDSADTVSGWETASTSDTITLNGTTTGGVSIGDKIELIDIASNQWAVSGQTTSSGTEATPFSAAVS